MLQSAATLEDLVKGKSLAVLGLGVSGLASAIRLTEAGAYVEAWDDRFDPSNPAAQKPDPAWPFQVRNLAEDQPSSLVKFSALLMSPGIPHTHPKPHPLAAAAKQAGLPLISDVELLMLSSPERRFLGITGTNGKSTTTALVAHILSSAGVSCSVGGNLGPAVLSLEDPGPEGWYVLELSSYQLELIDQARFDLSGFLNLSPDHLERHGGLAGYQAAKRRLIEKTKETGHTVICADQEAGLDFAKTAIKRSLPLDLLGLIPPLISALLPPGQIESTASLHIFSYGEGHLKGADKPEIDFKNFKHLPGRHNWQNLAIAQRLCQAIGLTLPSIEQGMASFPGLANRQEFVGTCQGVDFVNDSKATNSEATEVALKAYRRIHWIVGGQAKTEGLKPLLPFLKQVRKAYLIGESCQRFAQELGDLIPWEICLDLEKATNRAFAEATQEQAKEMSQDKNKALHNSVILLSPACASWDQFTSFEARGQVFRDLYSRLNTKPEE